MDTCELYAEVKKIVHADEEDTAILILMQIIHE